MNRRRFLVDGTALAAAIAGGRRTLEALGTSRVAAAGIRFGYAAITWGGNDPQAIDDGRSAVLDAFVTAEEFPALRRAVDAGVFANGDDPFAFGLERVLDGVADYVAKRAEGARPAPPPVPHEPAEVAGDKRVRETRKSVREAEKRLREARKAERQAVREARTRHEGR